MILLAIITIAILGTCLALYFDLCEAEARLKRDNDTKQTTPAISEGEG
jgi:hypothetical protein